MHEIGEMSSIYFILGVFMRAGPNCLTLHLIPQSATQVTRAGFSPGQNSFWPFHD